MEGVAIIATTAANLAALRNEGLRQKDRILATHVENTAPDVAENCLAYYPLGEMKFSWPNRSHPSSSVSKIIIGLGNPGPEYAGTRHNAGFMCLTHLAKNIGASFNQKEGLARTAHGNISTVPVVLARPQTFMNLSGQAVVKLTAKYGLAQGDLIVIHDDLDLPLGQVRIRQSGGSGGHRGIASVISELGSENFIRVRLGIGRPTPPAPDEKHAAVVDFVLEDFDKSESAVMAEAISQATEAVKAIITNGTETAMSTFNRIPPNPTK